MNKAQDELRKEIEKILEPVNSIVVLQSARGYPYEGPNIVEQLEALISQEKKALVEGLKEKEEYWMRNEYADELELVVPIEAIESALGELE